MDSRSIPQRSDAVKWQVVDDEAILVHLESGFYFSLNPVGLFIWQHADGRSDLQQIVEGLVGEFDVDEATAWTDAQGFVDHMLQEGLMTIEARSSAS